jgi:hypothetical protein
VSRSYDFARPAHNLYIFLDTGQVMDSLGLLAAMYQPGELTLQTCISIAGNDEWGRLFVNAHPMTFTRHALRHAPAREAI